MSLELGDELNSSSPISWSRFTIIPVWSGVESVRQLDHSYGQKTLFIWNVAGDQGDILKWSPEAQVDFSTKKRKKLRNQWTLFKPIISVNIMESLWITSLQAKWWNTRIREDKILDHGF